jgi:DNA topoisomerase-1
MTKTFVIVESPTKARTLSRFLGSEYVIEASMGHVRDLPEKKLGIDVNDHFIPQYEVPKKKKDIVMRLRKKAKEADRVVLATDPDREGEAIAWHIKELLTRARSKNDKISPDIISRIVFHEITKTAITDAFKHPRDINIHLVDAQQGRRVLDRLVGYKLSPLLWYKTGKNWLSAGRVQSVAVRLIVEREREIKAFIPEEYWEISAQLKCHEKPGEFVAKLTKIDDKTAEIKNKEQADTIVSDLEKAKYVVAEVKKTEVKKHPYPPFITSTLQRAASTLFGWSARKTMTIAQNLYEEGLITYHRTDSVQLSQDAMSMARGYIEKKYGKDYIPETPNAYKTSAKVAQEAHEAIRPALLGQSEEERFDKKGDLGRDHEKLLDLVTKRFLASQMKDQIIERTSIDVGADKKYLLRTSGDKQIFAGWRAVYVGTSDSGKLEALNPLPDVLQGDLLDLLKLLHEQKFTQPPSRFNEASLIKALEEQGIGRPSTYAPTIHTIQLRQYVEKNESRAFIPTDLGEMVNDFLVENFGNIINIEFTRDMEDQLDAIAKDEKQWQDVISVFWKPFEANLIKTRQTVEKVKMPEKKTGELCPEDGGELVERVGRYGKFLACNKFPTCKFTKPIVTTIDVKCPTCGGDIVIKKTKKGRKFFGCSNYPNCTFASWQKPGGVPTSKPEIPQVTTTTPS